jgi:hypothetical protein
VAVGIGNRHADAATRVVAQPKIRASRFDTASAEQKDDNWDGETIHAQWRFQGVSQTAPRPVRAASDQFKPNHVRAALSSP